MSQDENKTTELLNLLQDSEKLHKLIICDGLLEEWRGAKLYYDRFTLPKETKPCEFLVASSGGYSCAKIGECDLQHGRISSEYGLYPAILPDCLRNYCPDDSPIKGKTISDIESLEKAVSEMKEKARTAMEKSLERSCAQVKDLLSKL